eukprot:3328197-Pyramimonas_sp.AAC.1
MLQGPLLAQSLLLIRRTSRQRKLKGWVTNRNDRTIRSEQMLIWSDCKPTVDNVTKVLGGDDATYSCPDATER